MAEKVDFGPRIGFAYSPDWVRNTVLRGGYGIIYAALSGPNGGIWRSENSGQTWLNVAQGVVILVGLGALVSVGARWRSQPGDRRRSAGYLGLGGLGLPGL